MKRHILSAGLSVLTAAMVLTVPVSAQATAEDVFAAMEDVWLPEPYIQDARNHYLAHPELHDEYGMRLAEGGAYHTYDEWVVYIHEKGGQGIYEETAKAVGVDVEVIELTYGEIVVPEGYTPSVEQEKPFAEMSLEEKRTYIASLPEEERAIFLASLTEEERNSILKQLNTEQKQDILENMAEVGQEMGLTVSVDNVDDFRFSIRDQEGNLIDSSGFGLTVDATGWDTTAPVLLGAAMILTASGGILWMIRHGKHTED